MSEHFGLPKNIIFFADPKGMIYMNDMNVLHTLFPMRTARRADEIPEIFVKLQKGMSTLSYLDGNQNLTVADKQIEKDFEKIQSAKMKRQQMKDQERKDYLEKQRLKN